MKRVLLFPLLLVVLIVPYIAGAETITLPNPLDASNLAFVISTVTTNIAGLVAGIAALVMSWAGILFLTSAGNESRITMAKKAMFYGAIGLAIAIAGGGLIATIRFIITGSYA